MGTAEAHLISYTLPGCKTLPEESGGQSSPYSLSFISLCLSVSVSLPSPTFVILSLNS